IGEGETANSSIGAEPPVAVAVHAKSNLLDRAARVSVRDVGAGQRHAVAGRHRIGAGRERANLRTGHHEAGQAKQPPLPPARSIAAGGRYRAGAQWSSFKIVPRPWPSRISALVAPLRLTKKVSSASVFVSPITRMVMV